MMQNTNDNVTGKNFKKGRYFLGVLGTATISLTVITLSFIRPALRKICLPFVPATSQQINNIKLLLNGHNGRLIDIGSGDGRIVRSLSKQFKADGIELNVWLVLYSRFISKWNRLGCRFYRDDLFRFRYYGYDYIVIFGVKNLMEPLRKKLAVELKDDAFVVACRYDFENIRPIKCIGEGVDMVWMYDAKTLKASKKSIGLAGNLVS